MQRADLHIHSTASDGWYSPTDIVGLASAHGLDYIAICDHDTVDGVGIAVLAAQNVGGITVIPSVELSTDFGDTNVHLLGYWIDFESQGLRAHLNRFAEASTARIEAMAKELTAAGYLVTLDDLQDVADGGMRRRPHLARILVRRGYAQSVRDAFDRFIGEGAPFYKPYPHLSTKEGIDLIRESGGVPFVAHPALSGLLDLGNVLVDMGVAGIEAFHSRQTQEEVSRCLEIAEQYDLIISGGSDWHGNDEDGIAFGESMLPGPYLERFLASNPRELE